MPPTVRQGEIIFINVDIAKGLQQNRRVFHTLDELYALCLDVEPSVVESIIITGGDAKGNPRKVALTFRSATAASA
jgi:hypothetical protein